MLRRFLFYILAGSLATAPTSTQELCSASTSINFNATQMSGVWWEVARSPSLGGLACVKVNFTEIQSENVMQIATTYAVSTSYLWVNQTMYANISLGDNSGSGYNISYVNGLTTTKFTLFKLLQTDYVNYALFCGFTNATNNATSFGLILTRKRFPNAAQLNDYEDSASALYADFSNGTMPLVTQSPTCYASGAGEKYSGFLSICTLLYICLSYVSF